MKVNLNDLSKQKELLKYVQKVLGQTTVSKGLSRKLTQTIRFYEEVESDLELGGESIIELDKPRLEAIEERNKALSFRKDGKDEFD